MIPLVVLAAAAAASASGSGRPDRGALERAFAETGASRVPASPSWTSYGEAINDAVMRFLERLVGGNERFWSSFGEALMYFVLAVVAAGLIALVVAGIRLLVRSLDRKTTVLPRLELETRAVPPAAQATRGELAREFERLLEAGNLSGALRALWWWFARSLGEAPVDPAWTSRELLAARRRGDLAPEARELDSMIYGSRAPAAGQAQQLYARLAETLS